MRETNKKLTKKLSNFAKLQFLQDDLAILQNWCFCHFYHPRIEDLKNYLAFFSISLVRGTMRNYFQKIRALKVIGQFSFNAPCFIQFLFYFEAFFPVKIPKGNSVKKIVQLNNSTLIWKCPSNQFKIKFQSIAFNWG